MSDSSDLGNILDVLQEQRAIDFHSFKSATLGRRIKLRLFSTGMPDYKAYGRYLAEHPDEIDLLLNALSVTVSHFFRNPLVFEVLREFVVPELIASAPAGGLRIWCAGCGRGEEAYSIAILLRESCSRATLHFPVNILATDIDRQALAHAARGEYRGEALAEVKKQYLDTFFSTQSGELYRINDDIRSLIHFAYHNVTTCRSPREVVFNDCHLIFCRNVLIYYDGERGGKVVSFLARSLSPGGFLVLGEAETIPAILAPEFREVIPRTRIYRKENT